MKKLLGIVVLGLLLTSCSEYSAEQKLKYCADTEYSKEMSRSLSLYLHLNSKRHAYKLDMNNKFEEKFRILQDSGFPSEKIIDWISENIRDPEDAEKGFKDTIKRYDNEIKKFLKSSLNLKLEKSPVINYKYLFSQCEKERKKMPITFDARWKKADIQYLGDKIK